MTVSLICGTVFDAKNLFKDGTLPLHSKGGSEMDAKDDTTPGENDETIGNKVTDNETDPRDFLESSSKKSSSGLAEATYEGIDLWNPNLKFDKSSAMPLQLSQ